MAPFRHALAECRRALKFRGVSSRAAYWSFILVYGAVILAVATGIAFVPFWVQKPYLLLIALMSFPFLTASVRRLHDTGRSGWLILVPIVGSWAALFIGSALGVAQIFAYGSNPSDEEMAEIPAFILYAPTVVMALIFLSALGVTLYWLVSKTDRNSRYRSSEDHASDPSVPEVFE